MSLFNVLRTILRGGPQWKVYKDGNDIVVNKVWATAFGLNDRGDNGHTASGINLNVSPHYKGVALPMKTRGIRSLALSPLPRMPFIKTKVIVEDVETGRPSPMVPVIDLGPSLWTGNGLDLTVDLARLFDRHATANNFKRLVNYRVIGGAKYL